MDVVDESTAGAQTRKYKRKKRVSALIQARKYGKKGKTGRGSEVSMETYQYLVRVLELSNAKHDTPEEQDMFVNNTLDQMLDEAINYSSNQLGCRIIEKLLPLATNATVMKFIDTFGKDLRPLVTDRFASHVLQKLVAIASERGSLVNKDAELGEAYDQWVLKCSNFVLNNLEDFVWNPYANHIIRACLEALAGFKEKEVENITGSQTPGHIVVASILKNKRAVPPEFKEIVVELARRLMLWPQFAELAYGEKTCGLLCTLLVVLKATSKKATSNLVKKLLEECFRTKMAEEDDDDEKKVKEEKKGGSSTAVPDIFTNSVTTRLLDAAILVASPKIITKIYADLFLNNLGALAVMPIANFQVQHLFVQVSEKLEFEAMYDEIAPFLENIFFTRYYGVLVSIANACRRHATREIFFIKAIMKILHCFDPTERQLQIAPLVLTMSTFENKGERETIMRQGSMILQELLNFSKPIKIVDSLLAMTEEELLVLFSDSKGSYVVDAYFSGASIGVKSRDKMFQKLKGNFLKLACSKFGSRSLDGMWAGLNLGQKAVLMAELAPKEAILNSHEFGRIIAAKYNLPLFIYRKEDWMGSQDGSNKKRKLFEDIIGDLGNKKK